MKLPNGWKRVPALEAVTLQGGFAFKSTDAQKSGIRWLKIANVGIGLIKWDEQSYLPLEYWSVYQNFQLNYGDIVVAMTRPLLDLKLKIARIGKNDAPALLNQRVGRIIPSNGIDADFIYQVLSTTNIAKQFNADLLGTDPPNLGVDTFRNIEFLLPPLPEQKAIADMLSVWDTAIEKTEKLIAAKEQRFRWLLDELITKPSKCDKWVRKKLGEIGVISSAGVDKKIIEGETPVRLLNYLDVYRYDKLYSSQINHVVTAKDSKISQCDIQKGDIFFTPSSETKDDIGHSAVAMEDFSNAVYSYHIVRFRLFIDFDLTYRAFAFKTPDFYKQASKFCDGSGQRYVLSQDDFRNMEILYPPTIQEQSLIASILDQSQNEKQILRQLLDKYKIQKRGLMQKLLTGEWRVKY